jgi:hypothetical protein
LPQWRARPIRAFDAAKNKWCSIGGGNTISFHTSLHTRNFPKHIYTIRAMTDASQQSDLSIIWMNSCTRDSGSWDIVKPKPGQTLWYQSIDGTMRVERLRRGKCDPEPVAEEPIPSNCFIDFESPHQNPKSVFDNGDITVSCSAAGVSKCCVHRPGNVYQFSHLGSTAEDEPGSVEQP